MRKKLLLSAAFAATVFCSSSVAGAWFVLLLGQPAAHSDSRAQASGFIVRVYGCSAQHARLEVTAEGIVSGQRRSVAVQPVALANTRPETETFAAVDYAIPASWPREGSWVVKVQASTGWLSRSALVVVDNGSIDRRRTALRDNVTPADIDAAVARLAAARSATIASAHP